MDQPPFGERLKAAREKRGLTQLELSHEIGATPVAVSRWERGLTHPQPRFARKLRELLPAAFVDLPADNVRPLTSVRLAGGE